MNKFEILTRNPGDCALDDQKTPAEPTQSLNYHNDANMQSRTEDVQPVGFLGREDAERALEQAIAERLLGLPNHQPFTRPSMVDLMTDEAATAAQAAEDLISQFPAGNGSVH